MRRALTGRDVPQVMMGDDLDETKRPETSRVVCGLHPRELMSNQRVRLGGDGKGGTALLGCCAALLSAMVCLTCRLARLPR
jgi:hypothetical protein